MDSALLDRTLPLLQVLSSFGPSTIGPMVNDAPFRPPQRLLEVPGLLLANGHLLLGLQHRHLAPLGHEGSPDAVHLRVVLMAGLVILVQGRREHIPRPIQQRLQVGVHEMPVDSICLTLQELPERFDGPEIICREVTHPAQVVGIVRLVGGKCVAEPGPHRGSRCSGWCHWAKAEVGWVVVEKDAEPTRPVGTHPTHNGASKGDRLAVLPLQGKQTGPVSSSILAGGWPTLSPWIHTDTALAS